MSNNKKTDADILSELSTMPSVTPKARTSTLEKVGGGGSGGKLNFGSETEMNAYIQKCIQDALQGKVNNSSASATNNSAVSKKQELLEEYNNPRKSSSTGKHAGVNSFIRNLGTIGYGEERKEMVNHNAHANIKSNSKMAKSGDSRIADNILKKLNEREQKDKEKKNNPKPKPKFKPKKKKEVEPEPEMLTEPRKHYSFTKLGSVANTSNTSNNNLMQINQIGQQMPTRNNQPSQMLNHMQNNHMQDHQMQRGIQSPYMPNNQMQNQEMQGPNRMIGSQLGLNNLMTHSNNMPFNQMNRQIQNQQMQRQNQQMQRQNQQMQNQQMQRQNQQMQNQQMQRQNQQMQNQQMQMQNTGETPFVFIMPAFNGAKWIKRIFDSIKSQKYKNFRIIYIDDCSTDNTIPEINAYKKANPMMNIDIISNQNRGWPAYSRYVACRQTYDHEVCIFLDGDDWLVDDDCLSVLNTVYQNPNIYATFGSMDNAPWQFKKWKKYNRANINDGEGAYFPHLRTTRAAICKAIPPYYMQTETGDWLHVCTDVALFMAVIEAVGSEGYVFLKNPFVHYNTSNHNKNSKEGYTNSKGSDMRIYYRSTIRDKVPMKRITRNLNTQQGMAMINTPQSNMINQQQQYQQQRQMQRQPGHSAPQMPRNMRYR